MAMIEARKRKEQEAWEVREAELARKNEEMQLAEKARAAKMEREKLEQEQDLALKTEHVKIAADKNAERAADLEQRRLIEEEKRSRQVALADEWKQMREAAENERLEVQRIADAYKIARAATEKIDLLRSEEDARIRREVEIADAGKSAQNKAAFEERMRIESSEARRKEVALKEENFRNKKEFEKKAKESAQSTVDADKEAYEAEVRTRLKGEYAEKREEIYARDSNKPASVMLAKPTQFQMNLSDNYPMGVTEESELKQNREVKRLIVKRTEGVANQYSRVKWNWGGIYYFKNEQSTSKQIYDLETEW
jgi:hypothetical protein